MLDKWKRAVIHLECATDTTLLHKRYRQFQKILEAKRQGVLTWEKLQETAGGAGRERRSCGTALFISHLARRYLITAHHVVWDEYAACGALQAALDAGPVDPETREFTDEELACLDQTNIFPIIFRVPSLAEDTALNYMPRFLMNLGAGAPATRVYTFHIDNDLAVISLDMREKAFADELEMLGYTPINSDILVDAPLEEGQSVFTVGFPSSISFIRDRQPNSIIRPWKSSSFSLPAFAFGHVSMLHNDLNSFWIDMSSYPGNSGAPVIADGHVVGLVSRQAQTAVDQLVEPETNESVFIRIPFGRVIKGVYIRALLEYQHRKDVLIEEMFGRAP